MMKQFKKIYFLPALLLLIAYFMKLATLPNQLILLGAGILLIFIFLSVFLVKQIRKSDRFGQKVVHVLCFLLAIPVLFLPFAGVFEQGMIPVVIYLVMLAILFFYLIKRTDPAPNFIQPNNYRNFVLLNLLLIIFNSPFQMVLPDAYYLPEFKSEYAESEGPTIYIDEAHNNLHTKDGLYTTFSNILEKDGYSVLPFGKKFTAESLKNVDFLVISNALHNKSVHDWNGPVESAFTESEIKELNKWVRKGGSLFFIADHMPFGAASSELAQSFGYTFSSGTVMKKNNKKGIDLFSRKSKTLMPNSITKGRNASEYVDSIVTFTGQAIEIPAAANPILVFNDEYVHYSPETRKQMKGVDAEKIAGLSQGSYIDYGEGRLVVFGEAAMFSGQLPAGLTFWKKIGLNADEARNNYKLLLNIVHWLDHKMD